MLFQLDTKSATALYEQLEEQIAKYVCLGVLEEDEKLPSVRSMAGDLGINPNTVAKAYKLLELKEIIYTVAGKGVYVGAYEKSAAYFKEKTLSDFRAAAGRAKLAGILAEELNAMIRQIYQGGLKDD